MSKNEEQLSRPGIFEIFYKLIVENVGKFSHYSLLSVCINIVYISKFIKRFEVFFMPTNFLDPV